MFGRSSRIQAADPAFGKQPNIILIITDDQGYYDLSCHGNPHLATPNLDKLRDESLRFTRFQVSPTCAPTRSAIMSGRAPFYVGVTHTILERERMKLGVPTMPEMLRDAGYTTGIFGKWHLGDQDPYRPDQRGFDEVFIHGAGGIGQSYAGSCGDAPGNKYFDPAILHNNTFVKTKGFCTDIFFNQAMKWMETQKGKKPFFAYITTNAPHGPFIAPDSYKKKFIDAGIKGNTVGFYGMIENIDDNVGRLTAKLAEWGIEKDTLLIFITDNGPSASNYNGDHKGKKGSVDEGGTRVPSFWRWPGVLKPGTDVDRIANHYDILPTFAEIVGREPEAAGSIARPESGAAAEGCQGALGRSLSRVPQGTLGERAGCEFQGQRLCGPESTVPAGRSQCTLRHGKGSVAEDQCDCGPSRDREDR